MHLHEPTGKTGAPAQKERTRKVVELQDVRLGSRPCILRYIPNSYVNLSGVWPEKKTKKRCARRKLTLP